MISGKEIRDNLKRIEDRIGEAAIHSGRSREDIKLVVVSKTKPIEVIRLAILAGVTDLGENYAEEGSDKIKMTAESTDVSWHMIGHIQSRKANLVCEYYDFAHSVDSVKLARRLNRILLEMNRVLPVLLEFNISGEPSKFGWEASLEERWEQHLSIVSELAALSNIDVNGLMTIAPYASSSKNNREHFARLYKLREYIVSQLPGVSLPNLSMGMSADFEEAILEGATIVRIGSAILGSRN